MPSNPPVRSTPEAPSTIDFTLDAQWALPAAVTVNVPVAVFLGMAWSGAR